MSEIKPCATIDCQSNIIHKKIGVTYKHGCALNSDKLAKCYGYKPEALKRPITVQELFEGGASHVSVLGGPGIETISRFGEDNIRFCGNQSTIQRLIDNNYKFTTDRKTWHDFMVEDNDAT